MILFTLPPVFFVGARMFLAGIGLLLFNYGRSHRLKLKYLKNDISSIIIISLLTTCIPAILKAYALKHLISSKAAFLSGLDPFITVLYSRLLFKEKISFQKIIGLCFGFLGTCILLISANSWTELARGLELTSYTTTTAVIAALTAVAIGRYGWLLVQAMLKRERYTPAELNGLIMLTSGILAFSLSLFTETFNTISMDHPVKLGLLLAWTVIIGNIFGYTIYAYSLKLYSANFVALAGFSIPLFVAFFGSIVLQEPLTTNFFIALATTFVGLLIFYRDEFKKNV